MKALLSPSLATGQISAGWAAASGKYHNHIGETGEAEAVSSLGFLDFSKW